MLEHPQSITVDDALTLALDTLLMLWEATPYLSAVHTDSATPLNHRYAWWVGQLEGALMGLTLAVETERSTWN